MPTFARIDAGRVAEPPIESATEPPDFGGALVWVPVPDDRVAEVAEGWSYDEATGAFAAPIIAADPQQASNARAQRTRSLAACDWTQLPDVPMTGARRALWAAYRQALRDVPAQSGFPAAITWPEAPE